MSIQTLVSASLADVNDATGILTIPRSGQDVDIDISGTYAQVIRLERAVDSDATAWIKVEEWSTANATVSYVHTSTRRNEKIRVRMHTDTSGTAVVSARLQVASDNKITDLLGTSLIEIKSDGLHINSVRPDQFKSLDLTQRVRYFDDFLGDLLRDELDVTAGSGTGNAVALSAGAGGRLSILTSSADAAFTANSSAVALDKLDWRADQGDLFMEVRIQCDDISEAYIFIGFTDVLPSTTHEQPIFLVTTAIDSDATNAVGVCYDVDGTTKQWFHGGTKNGTDTAPVYSGAAPVQATYETIRVEVNAAGTVRGYVNGVAIGDPVQNAVTVTAPLAPVVIVANRSANAVTCLVDYWDISANR